MCMVSSTVEVWGTAHPLDDKSYHAPTEWQNLNQHAHRRVRLLLLHIFAAGCAQLLNHHHLVVENGFDFKGRPTGFCSRRQPLRGNQRPHFPAAHVVRQIHADS
jgi:hypothetical protein